jgi:hypothetical protein
LESVGTALCESLSGLEYFPLNYLDHQHNKEEQKRNKADQFPGVRFGSVDEMFD